MRERRQMSVGVNRIGSVGHIAKGICEYESMQQDALSDYVMGRVNGRLV
jgi:hypothetical protein